MSIERSYALVGRRLLERGRPCTLDRLCEALSAGPRRILGGAESAASQLLDDVGSTLLIRTADGWTVEYDVLKEADQYE